MKQRTEPKRSSENITKYFDITKKLVERGSDFASVSNAEDLGQPIFPAKQEGEVSGSVYCHFTPRKVFHLSQRIRTDQTKPTKLAKSNKSRSKIAFNASLQAGGTPSPHTPAPDLQHGDITLEQEAHAKSSYVKESLVELARMFQMNKVLTHEICRLLSRSPNYQ